MTLALKQAITSTGHNQDDIHRWMTNVTDMLTSIKAKLQGNYILSTTGLALGSNKDDVANVAFTYMIAGVPYAKTAITTGTAPGNDVVPQATYGAVAFDIGTNGTVDAIEAPANATGYATAALAVAALPAPEALHARMGWVTATKSDGAFTFGTTEFDAANVTAAFTVGPMAGAAITESVTLLAG